MVILRERALPAAPGCRTVLASATWHLPVYLVHAQRVPLLLRVETRPCTPGHLHAGSWMEVCRSLGLKEVGKL